ncbi:unnamed protein product [[Actinomadura] parvosata subsp. kistnae]|nr:unnamed protein product [Actinomadura parvosata subsp. kistnae]
MDPQGEPPHAGSPIKILRPFLITRQGRCAAFPPTPASDAA